MTAPTLDDLLGTPYVLGGREPGRGLDCLGTVLEVARRRGLDLPDPWLSLRLAWSRGEPVAHGFPSWWQKSAMPVRHGDVLLYYDAHAWSGIVMDGYVWTARRGLGVTALPVDRLPREPDEVWRRP